MDSLLGVVTISRLDDGAKPFSVVFQVGSFSRAGRCGLPISGLCPVLEVGERGTMDDDSIMMSSLIRTIDCGNALDWPTLWWMCKKSTG